MAGWKRHGRKVIQDRSLQEYTYDGLSAAVQRKHFTMRGSTKQETLMAIYVKWHRHVFTGLLMRNQSD
jgi:hypothetical protein